MSKEEELQRNMTLIEYYKEQLKTLEIQFSYLQNAIADQTKAKFTLENLSKEKNDTEVLVPLGGGAFINAVASKPSRVLLDVGSGIVLERTADDAVKKIETRIKELQQTEEKISAMAQQFQMGANEVSEKIDKLLSEQEKQ